MRHALRMNATSILSKIADESGFIGEEGKNLIATVVANIQVGDILKYAGDFPDIQTRYGYYM